MSQLPLPPPQTQFGVRKLSSVLTPLYKFGLAGVLLVALTVTCGAFIVAWPAGAKPWLQAANLILIVLVGLYWAHCQGRLKLVVACGDYLLIGNYLTQAEVLYEDIQEIKGYRPSSIACVRLRLATPCHFGTTIHFVLPSRLARLEAQPEIQLLLQKCPHLSRSSRGWWTIYFRPQGERS